MDCECCGNHARNLIDGHHLCDTCLASAQERLVYMTFDEAIAFQTRAMESARPPEQVIEDMLRAISRGANDITFEEIGRTGTYLRDRFSAHEIVSVSDYVKQLKAESTPDAWERERQNNQHYRNAVEQLLVHVRSNLRYITDDTAYEDMIECLEGVRVANAHLTGDHRYAYSKTFGDKRVCVCGHPYYRHFDTYDRMAHVGCKYCECFTFQERSDGHA